MKILYIEDNEINRVIFEATLSKSAEIHCAENGPNGLLLLENNIYDIIVIDINLDDPNMDGIDVIQIIITSGYRDKFKPKIYALTAYSGIEWEKKCADAGFDKFYNKPMNPLILIQ